MRYFIIIIYRLGELTAACCQQIKERRDRDRDRKRSSGRKREEAAVVVVERERDREWNVTVLNLANH